MKHFRKYIRKFKTGMVKLFSMLLLWSFCNISCEPTERVAFYNEEALVILDYIKKHPDNFSHFLAICDAAGMSSAIRAFNPYGNKFTLFLPTNAALEAYIQENPEYNTLDDLLKDTGFLRIFSRYHLVNTAYRLNNFPLGALKDTTATGDFISVSFQVNPQTNQTEVYLNNEARIIMADIEAVNGIIHVINKPLTPITFSSFDWLKGNPSFSIITEAFEKTGMVDTMGVFRYSRTGALIRNYYTLLVEPDSVFNKRGIHSFEDLKNRFASPGIPLNNPNNMLYQFTAYHILEGSYFLDDLSTGIYNTFGSSPMSFNVGLDITINRGFKVIDTIFTPTDTLLLNYVPVNLSLSNTPSRNGPIHVISELLEVYRPKTGIITHQFLDEPLIAEARRVQTTHYFDDPGRMQKINWSGVKYLIYQNATAEYQGASLSDYIYLDGPFVFTYEMPKIPSGNYELVLRAHSKLTRKATVQVYLDGRRVGSTLNLTRGTSASNWIDFVVGTVELNTYDIRTIRIESVVPGRLALDYIRFRPIE